MPLPTPRPFFVIRLHCHCRNGPLAAFVLALSSSYGLAVVLEFAVAIAVAFGSQPGRQRLSGCQGPAAVNSQAHLPYAAGEAVEMAVTVIMVRMSNDDIYAEVRVENKLDATDLLAAMSMGRGVCGRSVAYSPARWMIHAR